MAVIPHICVVGSLNIDFVTTTSRCPGPGETLLATSRSVNTGGKGANQAVACARASFSTKSRQDVTVSIIGAVGKDDPLYDTLLKPTLEESGVSTALVGEISGSQTGSATIIVEEGASGENRILVVPGANHCGMQDAESILEMILNHHRQPEVVVLQGEIPCRTVFGLLETFNTTHGSTTHVIFNAAPVFAQRMPPAALANLAVLIVNETEAVQLAMSILAETTFSDQSENMRPEQLANHFHHVAKIKIVIITLGAKGVFFSTETGRSGFVLGIKVDVVVDTTAAGDTFVGYFATALAKFATKGTELVEFNTEIEEAVKRANIAAAMCVQRKGAMRSVPFAYECCW